jgi:MtN3 and saliva related transmembrane protein
LYQLYPWYIWPVRISTGIGHNRRMNLEWLGFAAATLTSASFIPQAIMTIRTRDTKSISRGMYVIFTVGVALWLAYGIALGSWPMIYANTTTLVLAVTILALKLRYG